MISNAKEGNPIPGARPLSEQLERAGNPSPRYAPVISRVGGPDELGWVDVEISLSPGDNAIVRVPAGRIDDELLAHILATAPAWFSPRGLTLDAITLEVP